MFFLKHLYNQLIKSGHIAKELARDPDVVATVELQSATHAQRVSSLKKIVREILSFHETAKVVQRLHGRLADDQWQQIMKERAGYSRRKDYFDAQTQFSALMLDLGAQGREWTKLSNRERLVEICASTLAWLSYDWVPGGLETAYCQRCLACVTPHVFRRVRWELDSEQSQQGAEGDADKPRV